MTSVGADMPKQIERVSALRERYRQYAKEDGEASFAPAIFMMTRDLDAATAALAEGDLINIIRAYDALRGYTDEG